jgi:hypothetical protein
VLERLARQKPKSCYGNRCETQENQDFICYPRTLDCQGHLSKHSQSFETKNFFYRKITSRDSPPLRSGRSKSKKTVTVLVWSRSYHVSPSGAYLSGFRELFWVPRTIFAARKTQRAVGTFYLLWLRVRRNTCSVRRLLLTLPYCTTCEDIFS